MLSRRTILGSVAVLGVGLIASGGGVRARRRARPAGHDEAHRVGR